MDGCELSELTSCSISLGSIDGDLLLLLWWLVKEGASEGEDVVSLLVGQVRGGVEVEEPDVTQGEVKR